MPVKSKMIQAIEDGNTLGKIVRSKPSKLQHREMLAELERLNHQAELYNLKVRIEALENALRKKR